MNPTWVIPSVLNIPALIAAVSLCVAHHSRAVWPAVSPVRLVPIISSSQRCGSIRKTVSVAPVVSLGRGRARYLSSIPGERSCQPDEVSASKQDKRLTKTIKQTALCVASSRPNVPEFRYRIFIIFATAKSKYRALRFRMVLEKRPQRIADLFVLLCCRTLYPFDRIRRPLPTWRHAVAKSFFGGATAINWG